MRHPDWYAVILLAGAAYRLFRLVGLDVITAGARARLVGLPAGWEEGDEIPDGYRERLAAWIQCPWCLGFWIAIGWWVAWLIWPNATLWIAVPFVVSAIVGIIGHAIDA